jgi:hypothetical protein
LADPGRDDEAEALEVAWQALNRFQSKVRKFPLQQEVFEADQENAVQFGRIMRKVAVAVVSLLIVAGISAPAQATQGVAKKYSSCADLLEKYPNGVAKNKKARNEAVKGGFAKPKVSKSLYKTNGSRLDRDKDGVMCKQKAKASSATSTPAESADSVVYIPTGVLLLDAVYGSQADRGEISQEQATFISAFFATLSEQDASSFCSNWKSKAFQEGFLGAVATPDIAASTDLPGQEAWIRETGSTVATMYCVSKGYSYTVLSP